MPQLPYVAFRESGDEPGSAVGTALDELVAAAKELGCSDAELEERLQEALDHADEA